MFLEDDTDAIMIMIPPHKYDELEGQMYAENTKVDKTWLIVKGTIKTDWRMITIETIYDATDWIAD